MKEILLNIESKETRYALLRNGQLVDLSIERKKSRNITGNIYRGRVSNVLKGIQSAFIDIGEGENGFIHISDVLENSKTLEDRYDLAFGQDEEEGKPTGEKREKSPVIETFLQPDQWVLVQVVKEPMGTKGARLTSNISLAGRYLVLLPGSSHRGVSRKIEDRNARERLKRFIRSFDMPKDMGLILRTASCNATGDQLIQEAHDLIEQWNRVLERYNQSEQPDLLFEETDVIRRTLITALDKKLDRILVDDFQTYQQLRRLYGRYQTEHSLKIELYRDKVPMFERFNVEREIERTLKRKIWLGLGGYLFFDRTEAMHTIDVNSGRSQAGESDLEETLVTINLQAAEEIARQLRLRNVGGLIICDFIDMRFRKNQKRVLERLKECLKDDTAKCTVLGMSEFGLIEMTRQRSRGSLTQTLFCSCPYCSGLGLIKSHESISIEIERTLKKIIGHKEQYAIKLVAHPEMERFLVQEDKSYLQKLAEELNARLEITSDSDMHLNDFYFVSTINNQRIEA